MAAIIGRKGWCCQGYVTNIKTLERLILPSSWTKQRTLSAATLACTITPTRRLSKNSRSALSHSFVNGNSRTMDTSRLSTPKWNTAMYSMMSFSRNQSDSLYSMMSFNKNQLNRYHQSQPIRTMISFSKNQSDPYHRLIKADRSLGKEEREALLYVVDNIFIKDEDPNKEDPSDTTSDANALHYLASKLHGYQTSHGAEAVKLALPVYSKAGLLGNIDAKYTYAQLLLRQDPKESVKVLTELSAEGHGMACYDLACAYSKGYGVKQSHELGLHWFEKAAECGIVQAYDTIGKMYLHGEGCEKDATKAVEYFHQGAEVGDINACLSLGYCYDQGVGVEVDHGKAFELNMKAADAGHPVGLHNIGVSYFAAKGVENIDLLKAAEYYKKAAAKGNNLSQINLANMYFNGYGVEMDKEKAKEMYRNCSDPRAAELLKEVEHYEEVERRQKDGKTPLEEGVSTSASSGGDSLWSRFKKKFGS